MSATQETFRERQAAFVERMGGRGLEALQSGTIVVVPSISFPSVELQKITGIQHYEERMLFVLLFLAQQDVRIIYMTSHRIDPDIIDYYLGFLDDPEGARARLDLVWLDDTEPSALCEKLVARPDAVARIGELIEDPRDACMLPFNVSSWERRLSDALGIALYGPAPELSYLGSKSGSRRMARAAGVPVLHGSEDLYSLEEMEAAIARVRRASPDADAVVIKLNLGFSGQGNAIVEVDDVTSPLYESPAVFCAEEESWPSFAFKISTEGGIVEELVRRDGLVSPSAQLRVTPGGGCELVSTHDQILGGPDGQVYLGCRFPARPPYRADISDYGMRIGEVLAKAGVIGSFGMDFIGLPDSGGYSFYLGEINLRMGGTTHPFQMAKLISGAEFDPEAGLLKTNAGSLCYVATDNLKSDAYMRFMPRDVIELLDKSGLAFDPASGYGVTLHLLGAAPRYGKLGVLCLAGTPEDADGLFNEVTEVLDAAASR